MGWILANIGFLVLETAFLIFFIVTRLQKRKLNEIGAFFGMVFVLNMIIHFLPTLYNIIALNVKENIVMSLLQCLGASVKMFVGEPQVEAVETFAAAYPLFNVVYLFGAALALLATISTAVEVFSNTLRNSVRLRKALKQRQCDIVVGYDASFSLNYAKNCNAVLLLDNNMERDAVIELIESGYAVLRKSFSAMLFTKNLLNSTTQYSVICPSSENVLEYIDTFIAYKKASTDCKNIHLYVELEGDAAETIRREVVEKNKEESWITTFSGDDLLARTFAEEHPVTRYLPANCFEDGAVKPETDIHIFLLGFNHFSNELYRQLLLANQFATYKDGEYVALPVHYHLCDTDIDSDTWLISDLKEELNELKEEGSAYFPFPPLPFDTQVISKLPNTREVLTKIKTAVQQKNSYSFIIVDTDEDCYNMELANKLQRMLLGNSNFHLFIRSNAVYVQSDTMITYFGRKSDVLTREYIVNDKLSVAAKKLNEIYTAIYNEHEKDRPDFEEFVRQKAEEDWNTLDYFTQYSNIHAAMNLRVALNLLGLDYVKDGKGANTELIQERHQHRGTYTFDEYAEKSVRNALIAQEHIRWNAYHLAHGYLPMKKVLISEKERKGNKIKYNTKNELAKQHVCITTHTGLKQLSEHLAELSQTCVENYDYYCYDEMLVLHAGELLQKFGYSVVELHKEEEGENHA